MQRNKYSNISSDPEFWMILLFNGLFLYLYGSGNISVGTVIWIYFLQSLLLGFQYWVRMLAISSRSTEKGKWFAPLFFCGHFGLFHLVYFIFLIAMTASSKGISSDFKTVLLGLGVMLINTIFSTVSDVKSDKLNDRSAGILMFIPYLRIAPLHLFIILGFGSLSGTRNPNDLWFFKQDAFIVFIVLKTITDVAMHIIVNRTWKSKRERTIGEVF